MTAAVLVRAVRNQNSRVVDGVTGEGGWWCRVIYPGYGVPSVMTQKF
jgi:hypothetical protein